MIFPGELRPSGLLVHEKKNLFRIFVLSSDLEPFPKERDAARDEP